MNRGKWIVLGVMVATLIVVAAAAVAMFGSLSSAKDTRRRRDNARLELEGFFRQKPFPSTENIERERTNLDTVRQWHGTLMDALKGSNVPLGEHKPSIFNSRRETVMASLVAAAPIGEGGQRVVPADFGFGFDRYKTGILADSRDVPRLMRQLVMVETLVREFYAAGVPRILSITREEFEGQLAAEAETPEPVATGRRGRGRTGMSEAEASAPSAAGRIRGPVPMDRQRFTFEFLANEASLLDLLNRISRVDMFAVVTRVSFAKEGPDFVLAPAPSTDTGTATPPVVNPLPPSRTARNVSGKNREARIRVALDVDVFSFEGEG